MVEKTKSGTQRLVLTAAMAAAVFVCTLIIRIPIPSTGGYLNFGDAVIIFAALLFGPFVGAIAGGVGSAAADLVGFPVFVIPTLIIKGLLGLIAGLISKRAGAARAAIAALVAEVWMVFGYFATEAWIFRASMGPAAAASEVPFNIVQGIFGALLGFTAWFILRQRMGKNTPTAKEERKSK